jgi:predicted nucleic acid-binding protein
MKLSDALQGVAALGMDTAPFIYFVEKHPTRYPLCRAVFAAVTAGSLVMHTSTATLTETLVLPLRQGQQALTDEYKELLLETIGINTLPVSAIIAERAADLRARYNLRTPDAMQLAAALEAGCDAFLTNDAALQRVTEIRVIVLDQLTL